ncbi:hypothetical protein V8C34DRAFT_152934 [Trichoderma compactum]
MAPTGRKPWRNQTEFGWEEHIRHPDSLPEFLTWFEGRRSEVRKECPLPSLQERRRMKADEKEQLCTELMRALFSVFVGDPNINTGCFNRCVQECRRTDVLAARSLSAWRGYVAAYRTLGNSEAETHGKSGDNVYGCPKATTLMSLLACLCILDMPLEGSAMLKQMYKLKAIEHARTVVMHGGIVTPRQAYLWVDRGSLSAPEEKDGDEIESSGADGGSGTTDIASGGADNDSSS